MLNGLNDVDWSALPGAYGPCDEAPEILRALAGPATFDEGIDAFASSIWHQGTVYPVTVAVVPFLVELVSTPGAPQRDQLLHVLGAMSDPAESDGPDLPAVRAALMSRTAALLPLLTDADPLIREHAAFTLARCGTPAVTAIEQRWAEETNPSVRSSLLLALTHLNPDGAAALLRTAVTEKFPMPVAAAVAWARAGLHLAPEAVEPIAAAFGADHEWRSPWLQGEPLAEVLAGLDRPSADALAAAMTATPVKRGRFAGTRSRVRAAHALQDAFGTSRSAPVRMMPQLRAYLTDPEPAVRAAAAMSAAWAGTAAAAVASELIPLAHGEIDNLKYSPAQISLKTLVRLGDPRWREPMMAAWAAGASPGAVGDITDPPFDPELFTAARRRLAAMLANGWGMNDLIHQVALIGAWGPAAAEATPDIVAALPGAPWAAANALARIGVAAPLRQAFDAPPPGLNPQDLIRIGHALWRVTGDPEPLVAAAAPVLASSARHTHHWQLTLIADAGPAAEPLLPHLRPLLTGQAESYPERDTRIGAARIVWRALGDPGPVLETIDTVIRAGDVPARTAAALAADMAAEQAGAALAPALRTALRDEWAQLDAARALWHHGTDPAELITPLLAAIENSYDGDQATTLLVKMRATEAIPALTRLADRDKRIHGDTDEGVWRDDHLRRALSGAVAALSAR